MQHATGSLFGLAYGDALGKPTEFQTVEQIIARYGPGGPRDLEGDPALVTDDTQMALAVAHALHDDAALTPDELEPRLRARFVAWWRSPDNNRAPGGTCMAACSRLAQPGRWQHATVITSKGCGANMRVTPVGLIPGLDLDILAGIAQLQAALTHGHPTGLTAAELTAYAVRLLRDGADLDTLPATLRDHCASQRRRYHHDWLGDLWSVARASTPEAFIAAGWDECAAAVDRLSEALIDPDRGADPCAATGAAWIAEEALATGLYCALLFPDNPVTALARAATSSGDSDSIACLTGAFLGATGGAEIWPAHWATRIEYADQLASLGAAWDATADTERTDRNQKQFLAP
ncbi:ADP-ribosylglycohydrolase [Krasilnikovia cinnamomea]|uniref:ADP-ribosylglycohydrolase n=1 Tax=Krasilnikovia cinnamomea TaxID=349313 RepID=A0A4Q7Z9B7_9ACTN|nr:ADP-ribosylglycohydrolase family protein [Krasilnikovia cinnamomea]RZU46651.1 ADP-ribosylglycohydrolase [Krasilnikovia cinnamomea]